MIYGLICIFCVNVAIYWFVRVQTTVTKALMK